MLKTVRQVPGRKAWVTLVAGALAMLLAMPLGGAMGAPDHALMRIMPWLYELPPDLVRWFLLVVTAAIVAWAGRSIYVSAIRALRHGATNMNTLVSLGTAVAFLYSAFATIAPAPGRQVYYDAVLLILGFLLLGKSLEGRAKHRALAALDSLSRLRPVTARRIVDGIQTVVPLEEVRPGDEIVVLPGERFPVDATVIEGRTTVDESMLTGESTPLDREPGGRVLAGSLNYDGAIVCRAESLGEATVLAQIARMVDQAQSSRAPMERLADRASAIFVPVVLALAAITFIGWIVASHSFQLALANTVAVLVVACPCAMGLAVPAALTVAVGRGAQLGVLFKGGEALERLAHLDVVVLDKTGTLTVGRPVLESVHVLSGHTENDLLGIAAAAEERSNHPLAHAIVDRAQFARTHMDARRRRADLSRPRSLGTSEWARMPARKRSPVSESFIASARRTSPPEPGVTRLWMALDSKPAGVFRRPRRAAPRRCRSHRRAAPGRTPRADAHRRLCCSRRSHRAVKPESRRSKPDSIPPASWLAFAPCSNRAYASPWSATASTTPPRLPKPTPASPWAPAPTWRRRPAMCCCCARSPPLIPAALALARATLRIMRQNLGLGRRLQRAWHSPCRRPALSRHFTFCSRRGLPPPPWRSARSACWATACGCAAGSRRLTSPTAGTLN